MKLSNIWNGNGRRLKLSTGQMSDVKTRENVNDYDMWACLASSAYKQKCFIFYFSLLVTVQVLPSVYNRHTFISSPNYVGRLSLVILESIEHK